MPGMKDLVKGTDRYRHFIGGEWVDFDPQGMDRRGEPGDRRDHRLGAEAAAPRTPTAPCRPPGTAQPAWEALPPQSRGLLLRTLARLILENRERLAATVVAEQGKPIHEARGEIEGDGAAISSTPPRRRGASPATSSPPTIPTSRSGSRRWRTASSWR